VDDDLSAGLEPMRWQVHARVLAATSFWAMARRLPGLVAESMGLAWQASRATTAAAVGLHLAAGVFTAFGLLATTDVLRALLAEGPTPDRVRAAVPAMLIVVVVLAARSALEIAAGWAQSRLAPLVDPVVERRLFAATTTADLAAFDDPEFSDAMLRARDRGANSASRVVTAAIDVVTGLVGLVAAAGTLGVLHPLLLPLLVASAVPDGWAAVRVARAQYLSMYATSALRRRKWMLSDLLAQRETAAELRAYTAAPLLLAEYTAVAARELAANLRVARQQTGARAVGGVLSGLATGLVYGTLGLLLMGGLVPLAVAGTAVLAIQAGQRFLATLLHSANQLYEDGLYFGDYLAFCADVETRARQPVTATLPASFERIRVDGVTFTYPGAATPALRDVTLDIRRGEIVALVGENGSGKSTLAKLVAGLYRPEAGAVRWDDVDLSTVDQPAVWDRVALLLQDFVHWPLTAGQNITIGRHDHPDAGTALPAAARAGGADEVIAELPRGYRTFLSREFTDGHEISGGQWQRFAAARAFYRDTPLLICDEPTAALDARAEHALYTRLREIAAGRTVILITHRLASVRHADRIWVLHHGRVEDHGTHEELLGRGGRYAELFTLQAEAYATDLTGISDD